jgi:ComF family protein
MRISALLHDLLDFCYPGSCALCESAAPGSSPLCDSCETDLKKLACEASCGLCAMPLVDVEDPCPHCMGKGVRPYERIVRLGTFNDPLKHLIHHLKYHQRWPLAEFLADELLESERVKSLMHETDCIVPVPLHRFRQIARGYNQSEVVAKQLAKHCDIPLLRPVVRLRNTETQTHLHSREKRLENLRDAFGLVSPKGIRGKHVVVVDDVMTTGATLQAIGRVLMEAEPASLSAVILAIADPRRRDFEVIGTPKK